jgi:hypothetical protein
VNFISLTFKSQYNSANVYKAHISNKSTALIKRKNKFLSFDSSIYQTLADFNKLKNYQAIDIATLHNFLSKNWISEGYSSNEEEQKFKFRAHRMLNRYFYNPLDTGNESLIINQSFSANIGKGKTLFARIDKAYERMDGDIEVIDFKSGYVIKHKDNFELSPKSVALILVFYYKFGVYPDYLSYYYLQYNKKFTCRITSKELSNINSILFSQEFLRRSSSGKD